MILQRGMEDIGVSVCMERASMKTFLFSIHLALVLLLIGCGDDSVGTAMVTLHNDFDNPEFDRTPPWTICHAHYMGTDWDTPVLLGEESEEKETEAGLGYVFMVLSWDDPSCAPEHCLPVASRNEEETVDG